MNVLHVCRSFSPAIGGVETMVAALANRAVAAGHRSEILSSLRPPSSGGRSARLAERSVEGGIRVRRFDFLPVAFLDAAPGWRRELSEKAYVAGCEILSGIVAESFDGEGPDVVHCHGLNDDTHYLGAISTRLELPLVVTVHGPTDVGLDLAFASAHRYREAVTREALLAASRVTAVCEELSERVAEILPGVRPKLSTIPNGVTVHDAPSARDPRTGALLFAGRLSAEKGPDLLIETFARIARRIPEASLRIAGSGPLDGRLREMAKACAVADRVAFLGPLARKEVTEEMRRAAAIVVPSRYEACPLVVLEAMSASTPLIVSDIPAIREIVDPDTECSAFRAGDTASLERALCGVLSDMEGAAARAARAAEKARKKFDMYAVSESYFDIYEAILRR